MPTDKPSAAPLNQRSRSSWIAEFTHAAMDLWPEVELPLATGVALQSWALAPSSEPREAAATRVAAAKKAAGQ